jgi:hypothetical protein
VIRFGFDLRPLGDIVPWGKADDLSLHWFGLTDGWFWIELDGHVLLRYSDRCAARFQLDRPYVDYQVVRLWEDLITLIPAVLEPVPADLGGMP